MYLPVTDTLFLVSQVMTVFTPFHLFAGSCGGVVRGTGRQKIGAAWNVVGYYVFEFCIGVSLMFAAKLGIIGRWPGSMICVFFHGIFSLVYIWKIN